MRYQKISGDLKEAMKNKDELRMSVLRMLLSAVYNKEISLGKKETGLSEEEFQQVLRSEAKKRKEAAEEFENGGRAELAEKERSEADILGTYLPAEMPNEELRALVKRAVSGSEHTFGAGMKAAMAEVKGRASGERVSAMVREMLP
jgi:uncharacterized protein